MRTTRKAATAPGAMRAVAGLHRQPAGHRPDRTKLGIDGLIGQEVDDLDRPSRLAGVTTHTVEWG